MVSACSTSVAPGGSGAPSATATHSASTAAGTSVRPTSQPSASPSRSQSPTAAPGGVYAATVTDRLAPGLAHLKPLVYVPDEHSGDVAVIDPATFRIVDRFRVGSSPEHITPDWDLGRLYVNNMASSSLTIIDARTSRPSGTIAVPYPYNLYFTVDGSKAIVVDDFLREDSAHPNGLYFYDRRTWKLIKFLHIPFTGADHLDFSADGSYLIMSCESSGTIVKVDLRTLELTGNLHVGGSPVDVLLDPGGKLFYVANQLTDGVSVIDGDTMRQVGFIPTGRGAHGIGLSRDATRLFVTNRLGGSISVIELATRKVVETWPVGGSPDMMTASIDGSQLWVSNRYDGTVIVVDVATGRVLRAIRTGLSPHGLAFWPQPGRFSLGHNGNMR